MSWSSGFAFFSKLRFKAALWYLVLFAASSVLLFFLVSRYVANDMLRGADWLLESTEIGRASCRERVSSPV